MANREVLALNATTPQILAPQSGDTYWMRRDLTVGDALSAFTLKVNGAATGADGPNIYGQGAGVNEWLLCSRRSLVGGAASGCAVYVYNAQPLEFWTNGGKRTTIDANGNLIQFLTGTAPTLDTNSTMTFELTSNTSLKISVRGSDGVTRSVALTLA